IRQFQLENLGGDMFLHAIAASTDIHPSISTLSIIFIKNLHSGKIYSFSIKHPDSIPEVNTQEFLKVLEDLPNIKWAIDKKTFVQLTGISNVYDVNLVLYSAKKSIINVNNYD